MLMKSIRKSVSALLALAMITGCLSAGAAQPVSAASKNAVCQKYNKKINTRIRKIRNSKTDIQTTGTVFYVSSSSGNDANDGLSPEHAWKTCKRLNEDTDGIIYDTIKKNGGATVLFKRGDTYISFSNTDHRGMVGGECSGFSGSGSRYYNNYFYGCREGGFTVELG